MCASVASVTCFCLMSLRLHRVNGMLQCDLTHAHKAACGPSSGSFVRSVHLRRAAGTGSREQVRPRMIGNNMLLVFALMISSFCSRLACERMKCVGVPEQAANMVYVCARCSSACAFEHMIRFVLSETCMSAVALIVLWSSSCSVFRVG